MASSNFAFTLRNIHNPFHSNPYGQVQFNANVGSPKYYQDNGKISMTYDDSVARMTRHTFSPNHRETIGGDTMSSSTGFQQASMRTSQNKLPALQTQYQMMNNYQSNSGMPPRSPIKQGTAPQTPINDFTHTKFTESPYYSAHKTNHKFFNKINESPILGASRMSPSAKQSRNEKRFKNQSFHPEDAEDYQTRGSIGDLRAIQDKKYRERSPFDSNIQHGLTFMERVVRQKNYQINQRSLALTGRLAIDDHASLEVARETSKGPHKFIIIPVKKSEGHNEFKKTQCNITRFVKGLKDTRVQTTNNMCILRPNIR